MLIPPFGEITRKPSLLVKSQQPSNGTAVLASHVPSWSITVYSGMVNGQHSVPQPREHAGDKPGQHSPILSVDWIRCIPGEKEKGLKPALLLWGKEV